MRSRRCGIGAECGRVGLLHEDAERLSARISPNVMAGLMPAIHEPYAPEPTKTWMAGLIPRLSG